MALPGDAPTEENSAAAATSFPPSIVMWEVSQLDPGIFLQLRSVTFLASKYEAAKPDPPKKKKCKRLLHFERSLQRREQQNAFIYPKIIFPRASFLKWQPFGPGEWLPPVWKAHADCHRDTERVS